MQSFPGNPILSILIGWMLNCSWRLSRFPNCFAGSPLVPVAPTRVKTDRRLEFLLAAEAWTEAALLLVEIYLAECEVRYLRYDGSEWRCLLSPRTNGHSFDGPAEAAHRLLSVAILRAVLVALCLSNQPLRARASVPSLPDSVINISAATTLLDGPA